MFGLSHFQNVRTKLVLSILNIWIEVLRLNQNFCAKVLRWNPKRLNASVASKPVCLRQSLSSKPKLFKQKFCFAFNQNAWRKVFLWMQLFWTILLLEKTKKVQAQNSWFKTLLLGRKSSFWSQVTNTGCTAHAQGCMHTWQVRSTVCNQTETENGKKRNKENSEFATTKQKQKMERKETKKQRK